MEKKNESKKKPSQSDLKRIMALGNLAEKSFKKEALEKIKEQESSTFQTNDIPEPTSLLTEQSKEELVPETVGHPIATSPVVEKSEPTVVEKPIESEQQKNKEEPILPLMDVPFEVFLKKYIPSDTDRRETAWVYTHNLKIIKAIATSEDAPIVDIINNILSEWAKKYNKNIRKSLQKPSKMLDFRGF